MTAGGLQVHYARAGRGAPIVLLHASPGDHRPLRGLAGELARRFTVYALDTPGHGGSDRLPVADPDMTDYAAALGRTLDALGLDRVHLYGTHTGAKIALTFAVGHPGRVASLVLDGLGVSTPEERADQLANYLPPVRPRGDGAHLVSAWHQVRNMYLYWPWYREEPAARLPAAAMPSPERLHEVTTGLLEAGDAYPLAYRAAFICDPVPLLARLTVPTLILASPDDPLHAHLSRIPTTRSRTEPSGGDPARLAVLVGEHAAVRSGGMTEPPGSPAPSVTGTPARRYVPARTGASLVRWAAPPSGARPLVVLPPAPASGRAVRRLLEGAAASRPVVAVDLPGTGDSEPRHPFTTDLDELAGAVVDVLDGLGLNTVDLYGGGAGAVIAAAVAARHPDRVHALALAAPPDPRVVTPDLAARRTPGLVPDDHGVHLLRAWHLVRDGALRAAARVFDPDDLHMRVLDIVKAWPCYGTAFRAALGGPWPAELRTPVVVADPPGDPFLASGETASPPFHHDGRGGAARLLAALDELTV
ncbi:pimeloyl-ACP methyl ester carboxylesterase [Sphaerisporangium siamense]|uniref:Pimeloyl-ACP methyl ester carboxylesterase n=1 Tax=Sphaerisporangium siamense TaxID=795645 RepID=A0A7W7GAY6_9ACTN|nr:alpha/beta hydrolase [Sphaerisporangium siamense]MBB4704528.1 pimeloyl-ACP methyl ester carboxylesterase [Sphaerisporangium siamense]